MKARLKSTFLSNSLRALTEATICGTLWCNQGEGDDRR